MYFPLLRGKQFELIALREICDVLSKKRYQERGQRLRNPFFKGCVGPKNITFVRGTILKPPGLQIFEGFMDLLSVASEAPEGKLGTDAIILNSLSCMDKARLVPMLDAQVDLLKSYLQENRLNEPDAGASPLFFNSKKEKLTRAGINHIVQKYYVWQKQKTKC